MTLYIRENNTRRASNLQDVRYWETAPRDRTVWVVKPVINNRYLVAGWWLAQVSPGATEMGPRDNQFFLVFQDVAGLRSGKQPPLEAANGYPRCHLDAWVTMVSLAEVLGVLLLSIVRLHGRVKPWSPGGWAFTTLEYKEH